MLSSGVRRMWKCMSITGELQCGGAPCAQDGDAKATAPNEVKTARLSIFGLPFWTEANPLFQAVGSGVGCAAKSPSHLQQSSNGIQEFTLGFGSDITGRRGRTRRVKNAGAAGSWS